MIKFSNFKTLIHSLKISNLKLKIGVALAITLTLLVACPPPAYGQTRTFTVSPPSLKFTLKPGDKTEKTIKVTNQSSEALEFIITTEDYIVTNNAGTPELLPPGTLPDNRYAASTWAAVIPDTFSIDPGKSFTTSLYLQIPGNAGPGGHYFAVAVRPTSNGKLTTSGASVNTVIGSLVYLTVAGKIKENARIISFSAPAFSEYGPIRFTTEIHNFGDAHISPRAAVEVKDLFGRKTYSFALDNLNIFPGTSRVYKNSWETKWLFGRYRASLAGYFGQNNQYPLTASFVFWVIPYKLIAALLLAIVIGLVLYLYFKKKQEPPAVVEG